MSIVPWLGPTPSLVRIARASTSIGPASRLMMPLTEADRSGWANSLLPLEMYGVNPLGSVSVTVPLSRSAALAQTTVPLWSTKTSRFAPSWPRALSPRFEST